MIYCATHFSVHSIYLHIYSTHTLIQSDLLYTLLEVSSVIYMLCHDGSTSGIWAAHECSTSCWAAWCNFSVKVPFRDYMYSWSQTIKVQTYLKHSLPPSLLLPITLSVPQFFSPITFSLPPSFSISLSLSIPPSPPSLSLSLNLYPSPVFYHFLPSVSPVVPLVAGAVVSVSLLVAALMIIVVICKRRTSECLTL